MSAAEGPSGGPPPGEPTEEELRAAYEAELSRITTDRRDRPGGDLDAEPRGPQAGARPEEGPDEAEDEQDLEQVRDAIDASRALIEILERRIPADIPPLKDALSRLQMAYAKEVQRVPAAGAAPEQGGSGEPDAGGEPGADASRERRRLGRRRGARRRRCPGAGGARRAVLGAGPSRRPGPAESSGRLWVPGK